jgi:hypothetical protein
MPQAPPEALPPAIAYARNLFMGEVEEERRPVVYPVAALPSDGH